MANHPKKLKIFQFFLILLIFPSNVIQKQLSEKYGKNAEHMICDILTENQKASQTGGQRQRIYQPENRAANEYLLV